MPLLTEERHMRRSPLGCVSLRLPQLGLSAKCHASSNTKRLAAYSHHFNQKRRVPGPALGHFVGSSNATYGVSPMNWLPGEMNPATGDTAYPISEEESYELSNRLL